MYGRCKSCTSPLSSQDISGRCKPCTKIIHKQALDKINKLWDRMVDLDGKA